MPNTKEKLLRCTYLHRHRRRKLLKRNSSM
nr:MAG TPA: hypothetical protein [Caudoviricetes sp.]